MIFELSDGTTLEFRGGAGAEVIEAAPMDRKRLADEIAGDIERLGIEDTSVRATEEGVAISLEDIEFRPDSAELVAAERTKLDRIAEILGRYPDRDILVGGHTALAGTEEGRRKLSQERAAAVADYLVSKGARVSERVVVRGYGATVPIADNAREEGRRRNRRVEITLLEN
jgi:outer membrane protein OmpA-like peptidoglycan-associated protein